MGMYSQTLRIHSARPLPTPTAQRKNATLLRMAANFAVQSVGGHARAQGFDLLTNAGPAARASQTADFSAVVEDDACGVSYLGVGDVRTVGLATGALTAAAWVAAIPSASTVALRTLVQGSATRATVAMATCSVGELFQVGQWQFKAIRGTPDNYGEFDISSSDTNQAASFAEALNRHPGCSVYFGAVSSGSSVYVYRFSTPPVGGSRIYNGTGKHTITQLVATAVALTRLAERTTLGNFVGVSAVGDVSMGGSYMTGGSGDDVAQQSGVP